MRENSWGGSLLKLVSNSSEIGCPDRVGYPEIDPTCPPLHLREEEQSGWPSEGGYVQRTTWTLGNPEGGLGWREDGG